jgi:hypothetical protein
MNVLHDGKINQVKNKKYHAVRTVQTTNNWKIVEIEAK